MFRQSLKKYVRGIFSFTCSRHIIFGPTEPARSIDRPYQRHNRNVDCFSLRKPENQDRVHLWNGVQRGLYGACCGYPKNPALGL